MDEKLFGFEFSLLSGVIVLTGYFSWDTFKLAKSFAQLIYFIFLKSCGKSVSRNQKELIDTTFLNKKEFYYQANPRRKTTQLNQKIS